MQINAALTGAQSGNGIGIGIIQKTKQKNQTYSTLDPGDLGCVCYYGWSMEQKRIATSSRIYANLHLHLQLGQKKKKTNKAKQSAQHADPAHRPVSARGLLPLALGIGTTGPAFGDDGTSVLTARGLLPLPPAFFGCLLLLFSALMLPFLLAVIGTLDSRGPCACVCTYVCV
jgi:hypothetical protein